MLRVGDVMATLYLDNQLVGQTGWKPCNQSCWDQRFTLELERVKHTVFEGDFKSMPCPHTVCRCGLMLQMLQYSMHGVSE